MKPNISLACKKSSFFPLVKTVLGELARGKFPHNPSPNTKANPNPNPNRWRGREVIFFGGIVRVPVETKETKKRKEIRNNRKKKKEIKQNRLILSN